MRTLWNLEDKWAFLTIASLIHVYGKGKILDCHQVEYIEAVNGFTKMVYQLQDLKGSWNTKVVRQLVTLLLVLQ